MEVVVVDVEVVDDAGGWLAVTRDSSIIQCKCVMNV